jgi:hypothetical protein
MGVQAAEALISRMWSDMVREDRRREHEAAKAAPLEHKDSRLFAPDVSPHYHYFSIKGRGRETRYCYSVNRNVAGFYLGWREVVTKTEIRRDMWSSRRVKQRLIDLARKRVQAHRARLAKAKGEK